MASTAGRQRATQRETAKRGPAMTIILEGKTYTLAAKDMTALDVREMRMQTGYSYNALARAAVQDMDVDLLAAVVWMARRIDGERDLTYAEVAAGISYADDYDISTEVPAEKPLTVGADDSPEA